MTNFITWTNFIEVTGESINESETGKVLAYDVPHTKEHDIRDEMLALNFNGRNFKMFYINEGLSVGAACCLLRELKSMMVSPIGVELRKSGDKAYHCWYIEEKDYKVFMHFWEESSLKNLQDKLVIKDLKFDNYWKLLE